MRLSGALVSAFATLAIVCSSTAAAATTVGATFPPTPDLCSDTILQTASPNGQYTVPFSGVLTSWSYQAGAAPPLVNFKVARSEGGNQFTIIGDSGQTSQGPSLLNNHPIRIPVRVGDVIGAYGTGAGTPCRFSTSYDAHRALGDRPAGDTTTYSPVAGIQIDIAAGLEPDADSDDFGDESQDKCVGTPGTANGCPSTVTIDRLKQKGNTKVKVSVTVPGAGTVAVGSPTDRILASKAAKGLKAVTRTLTATSKQQLVLTLKLTKAAIAKLADAGKLKLKVKAVYTPVGGPPGSATKKKKLRG